MKKSVSNSSIDKNLEKSSLLFLLLLWMRSQVETLIGERLKDMVGLRAGMSRGELRATTSTTSPRARPASRILVVQSSKYLMLVLCLLSMTGVWRTTVEPWLTIQEWERTSSAVSLAAESLTRSLIIRSLASADIPAQCWLGKTRRHSVMLQKRVCWH